MVIHQLTHQVPILHNTSIGDDNIMYRWNTVTSQATKFLELDSFATDHDWITSAKGSGDAFAVGFADGSFRIYNKSGKAEKTVPDAHSKSIINMKWSYDGSALATTSQDGALKIWSRNGSLRTNLVQNNTKPIYAVSWSP
jgi:intraflagellar transport protein 80